MHVSILEIINTIRHIKKDMNTMFVGSIDFQTSKKELLALEKLYLAHLSCMGK